MKHTIEEIHKYLNGWKDDESWRDLHVMLDQGDTEMAANYLVEAGAICPNSCDEYWASIERDVVKLANKYRKLSRKQKKKRMDEVFGECFIASCNDCNCVSFLDDGNEELYPEVKEKCWECESTNIETRRWGDK